MKVVMKDSKCLRALKSTSVNLSVDVSIGPTTSSGFKNEPTSRLAGGLKCSHSQTSDMIDGTFTKCISSEEMKQILELPVRPAVCRQNRTTSEKKW